MHRRAAVAPPRRALRRGELRRLALPAPGQQQQSERLQLRGQLRLRPAHPTRKDREPAGRALSTSRMRLVSRYGGDAGCSPARERCGARPCGHLIRGRAVSMHGHCPPSSRALSPTASDAGACPARGSAPRAPRPTRFSRSPFGPMTMGFWPSRSTQIMASTVIWPSSSTCFSTSTAMPYGTSWLSSMVSFSRMVSAMRNRSPRSVISSGGNMAGATGRRRAMASFSGRG